MTGLEIAAVVALASAFGWYAVTLFKPEWARKAERAWRSFRPVFDAVEWLAAAGVIPKSSKLATYLRVLELAGEADDLDEAAAWAEEWAKRQTAGERRAFEAIAAQVEADQAVAEIDEQAELLLRTLNNSTFKQPPAGRSTVRVRDL